MAGGRRYALLVANGSFEDSRLSALNAPLEDVEALGRLLDDNAIGAFDEVRILRDPDFETLRTDIHDIFDDRQPDDLVLFYYSGHGLLDIQNKLYLATSRSNIDRPVVGSIEASYLRDRMRDSRARKQIVLLDCCHSGAYAEGTRSGQRLAVTKDTFDLEGAGTWVVTASTAEQFAWEGNTLRLGDAEGTDRMSRFTGVLVEALEAGADSSDEQVSVRQLYDYLSPRIVDQRPQLFVDKGTGDVFISRNPRPPIAADLLATLESEHETERLAGIVRLWRLAVGGDPKTAASAKELLARHEASEPSRDVHDILLDLLEALSKWRVDADDLRDSIANEWRAVVEQLHDSVARLRRRFWLAAVLVVAIVVSAATAGWRTGWIDLQADDAALAHELDKRTQELESAKSELATVRKTSEQAVAKAERAAEAMASKAALLNAALAEANNSAKIATSKVEELTASHTAREAEVQSVQSKLAAVSKELAELRDKTTAAISVTSRQESKAPGQTFKDCETCPELVVIPAGSFAMGSPPQEAERDDDEGPVRTVRIAEAFALGRYEVTFAEWDACVAAGGCAHKPADRGWGRGRRPVIDVSWMDAQEYVAWLSGQTGQTYRLPSEAEWEYAARAGTATRYWWGDAAPTEGQANFGSNRGRTVVVGSYRPNAFGVYDSVGNVWEWVQDRWHGSYEGALLDGSVWEDGEAEARVLRGGSWVNSPGNLRSANRIRDTPAVPDYYSGFRVSRTLSR